MDHHLKLESSTTELIQFHDLLSTMVPKIDQF